MAIFQQLTASRDINGSLFTSARGIEVPRETLATDMFAQTGLSGEFLKLKETRPFSAGAASSLQCH
jgi:trimethylamine:corrinoid methyltransferase-like protein